MQNLTPRLIPPVVAEQSTILSNWVVVLYRMLLNQGLDAENIFLEEGIKKPLSSIQAPAYRTPR